VPGDSPAAQKLFAASQAEHGGEVVEAFPLGLDAVGNGKRFARAYGGRALYVADWKSWLYWHVPPEYPQGGWWRRDNIGQVQEWAKLVALDMGSELRITPPGKSEDEARRELNQFVHRTLDSGIGKMLEMASSEPTIAATPEMFDVDPWLFNFHNGTLDLRTGEFAPALPEHFITKSTNTHYDASADAPPWRAFLSLVQPSEIEQAFLQRAVVYSMTGLTVYPEAFFVLCGTAGTGKSTFTDTLMELFGDYAKVAPTFMLLKQRGNDDRKNEIAWIRDARLVVVGETDERARISISTIKSITGGDRMVGRRLNEQYSQSKATHKMWLHTNYEPDPGINDIGFFDRLKLIRFDQRVRDGAGAEALRELCGRRNIKEVLAEHLPGIANWALEGLPAWREHGLGETDAVKEAVKELQRSSDLLRSFIAECLVKDPVATLLAKDCYAVYKAWCGDSGYTPDGKKMFNRHLREAGFVSKHEAAGDVWLGLRRRGPGETSNTPWKHPDGDDGLFTTEDTEKNG